MRKPLDLGDANLSSRDGVDAQIDALKRLARTRVGGHECAMPCAEFADIVERLDAARKRELASTCNAAAMRAALEKIKKLNRYDLGCIRSRKRRDEFDAKVLEIERTVRAALAAFARNCDRFRTAGEAKAQWEDYCHSAPLPPGGWCANDAIDWLFAKAEGVAKCVNGLRGDPDCRGCEEHCEDVRRRNCINWSGDHCAKTKGIFCPVSCDEFRAYKPVEGGAQ